MFPVRVIKGGDRPVYGIALPKDIGILSRGVFFNIKQSGTTIILESGCKIQYTEKQINDYKFEDCVL
jgi:hypothetical protein